MHAVATGVKREGIRHEDHALGAPLADTPTDRTPGLAETDPVGTGSLVLAGIGVAGVALFLAGAGVLLSSRSRQAPEAARVT